jgi:hypothetical protein
MHAAHNQTVPMAPSTISPRQANKPCYVVGNTALPGSTQSISDGLANIMKCNPNKKSIGNVPDVFENEIATFSSINFADSGKAPLQFALDTFVTAQPLASSNLAQFQEALDVYIATEAGLRSSGGNLAIKEPKFFLEFQIARIKTAQGQQLPVAESVDHLLQKLKENAITADKPFLGQCEQLAKQLK